MHAARAALAFVLDDTTQLIDQRGVR